MSVLIDDNDQEAVGARGKVYGVRAHMRYMYVVTGVKISRPCSFSLAVVDVALHITGET